MRFAAVRTGQAKKGRNSHAVGGTIETRCVSATRDDDRSKLPHGARAHDCGALADDPDRRGPASFIRTARGRLVWWLDARAAAHVIPESPS